MNHTLNRDMLGLTRWAYTYRSMTHYGIQAGTTRQPTGQAGRVKIGVLPTCPFSTFHLASPAIVGGRKTNRVRHLHGYIKAVSQLVSCRRKKQTP
jgi:hypothetical protein